MKKALRRISPLLGLTLTMVSAPALADVKAGVDAWGRGDFATAISEWRGPANAGDADANLERNMSWEPAISTVILSNATGSRPMR